VSLSSPFVRRPVGTTLLTIALVIAGVISFRLLPVAPLPQVDFPTISVVAGLPGASPATMASAVATPLERQFGRIAGVTEMTSVSFLGASTIALQFDLARDINGAARDVQSAINAAAGTSIITPIGSSALCSTRASAISCFTSAMMRLASRNSVMVLINGSTTRRCPCRLARKMARS